MNKYSWRGRNCQLNYCLKQKNRVSGPFTELMFFNFSKKWTVIQTRTKTESVNETSRTNALRIIAGEAE